MTEPYYTQAEKLYQVHGQRGLDPTEPQQRKHIFSSCQPRAAHSGDSRRFAKKGLHPFYLPLAIRLSEANRVLSTCIRCNTCDGFPCLVNAKSDADISCVRPNRVQESHLTNRSKVLRLLNSSGLRYRGGNSNQGQLHFYADIVGCLWRY